MFGGIGLIASGVLGVLPANALGYPALMWVTLLADLVYAASALLLAIGLSRRESIVARRPLGVCAIAMLAIWPLIGRMLLSTASATEPTDNALTVIGYLSLLVPTGAALIAVVQIARCRTVPAPWNRAPAWVLGGQVAVWALPQISLTAGDLGAVQTFLPLFSSLGVLAFLSGTVGLGVVAVYLAARQRPTGIQVYRST